MQRSYIAQGHFDFVILGAGIEKGRAIIVKLTVDGEAHEITP
jgi:hypothetical protein